jgi:hypothetical protein
VAVAARARVQAGIVVLGVQWWVPDDAGLEVVGGLVSSAVREGRGGGGTSSRGATVGRIPREREKGGRPRPWGPSRTERLGGGLLCCLGAGVVVVDWVRFSGCSSVATDHLKGTISKVGSCRAGQLAVLAAVQVPKKRARACL